MKIDVYKKIVDKKPFISLDFSTREYLFSIISSSIPKVGEKILLDESGQEYEVIKVQRVLAGQPNGKTYNEEYFIIEVEECYLVSLENHEIREATYKNIK